MMPRYNVSIKQMEPKRFTDPATGEDMSFDAENVVKGTFQSWGTVEEFVAAAVDAFPNATITISVEQREG